MNDEIRDCIMVMVPKPSPYPLRRIGGDRDGAYLVPDDLEGVRACFSPGVNNFKRFEDELTVEHGIACHMCDKSSDLELFATPLIEGMQTFRKKWLDIDGAEDSVSLEDWIAELAPDPADDLVLQMDIEGAEYRNLLDASDEVLSRFRIIVMELHGLEAANDPEAFEVELGPLLRKLDRIFVCVHAHPNNCGGEVMFEPTGMNLPKLIELTFLRRDRFERRPGARLRKPVLPHPLDIGRNVKGRPPLFLNAAWTGGEVSDAAEAKMRHDLMEYHAEEALPAVYRYARAAFALATGDAAAPEWARDLAQGRPFKLSSAHGGSPAAGVVEPRQPFFFHTDMGAYQSITVDLGAPSAVEEIVISNRTDMCEDRADYLFFCLHDGEEPDFQHAFPIDADADFVSTRGGVCRTRVPGLTGRYATVFSPVHTALHFSGLSIIGRPAG